jgi:hypothetical protein
MDQLNEVIQKYEETYDILLCGDMNTSLHRDGRRRDRIFKNFTVESNLILPTNYPNDFTFHHHTTLMKVWSEVFIASNGMIETLGCRFKVFPLNRI